MLPVFFIHEEKCTFILSICSLFTEYSVFGIMAKVVGRSQCVGH